MREGLTYSDVLIVPKYSNIPSRSVIDITTSYLGGSRIPIISAPMDYVTGHQMAIRMDELGGYGIISRFLDETYLFESRSQYGQAIGTKNLDDTVKDLITKKPHSICIDVAHGHHEVVKEVLQYIKNRIQKYYEPLFIAGNVATAEGFDFLARAGANAIRVGIGPGSACSTRENTGIGVPQLTAIFDAAEAQQYWPHVNIIADGGINTPGDIVKALAAGADAVMMGKMLAGHDENPGELIYEEIAEEYSGRKIFSDKITGKHYRGQSLLGSNGDRGAPEGVEGVVDYKGSIDKTINSLVHYIKSGFSYVGAQNIEEFRAKAEFIKVSPGTFAENDTRL